MVIVNYKINRYDTNIGWTGTKNGLRFVGGICVGQA